MPLSGASIFSIQSFGGTTLDISLVGYMIMMSLGRLAAAIILTVFICALSYFTKRAFAAMIISGAITLLPTAMAASGLKAMRILDYTRFMSFTPMYTGSEILGYIIIASGVAVVGIACVINRRAE